jgi:hypothetical protein
LGLKQQVEDGKGTEKSDLRRKSVGIPADPVNANDLEEDLFPVETLHTEVKNLVDLERMD